MTRIRPAAWLTVALFLLAVAGYALLVHASPQYYWTQIDTAVYRDGGIAVRNQPAMLYALELGAAKLPFTYTPFAALLFAAGSGASFAICQVGLAVLTIGLLPVVAYLPWGSPGGQGGGVCDRRGRHLARTGCDDTVLRADQPRAATCRPRNYSTATPAASRSSDGPKRQTARPIPAGTECSGATPVTRADQANSSTV